MKGGMKMNAVIVTKASAKEIAALVLEVQERRRVRPAKETPEDERESLIRQYESEVRQLTRRLEKLKAGSTHIIF